MVNFSSQIHNLVLLLITIQVASNGAAKITSSMLLSNETSTRVARKAVPINGEQLVKSNEENLKRETDADPADGLSDSLSTAIEVRNTNARAYSYFYVGSWVWHIPLWFTLWFSFYVAFNVVRAIYGHKVRILFSTFEGNNLS